MQYVIKVGSQYVTATGELTDRQADALRVDLPVRSDAARLVKIRPRSTGGH